MLFNLIYIEKPVTGQISIRAINIIDENKKLFRIK